MSDEHDVMPEGPGSGDRPEPDVAATRSGLPRPALIGLGLAAAIVLVLAAIILLRPDDGAVGEASPSPTASPTLAPTPTTSSEPAQPSAAPTASASAMPGSWIEAARFSEPGKRYVLGDLVAWSDGLIAVGTLYEDEGRAAFGPPPPRGGRVWSSADGTAWTDVTPAGTFDDVELNHLFQAADGALVVIGNSYPEVNAVSAAWETRDGVTWSPIVLAGIPDGASVAQVASGARGHVAHMYAGGDVPTLYSADGRTWQPAFADERAVAMVAAGDEGFVASTFPRGAPAPEVLASGDGVQWVDATEPDNGAFVAAPRGEDWLATTYMFREDGTVTAATWGSANGLDWSPLGSLPLQSIDVGGGVTCWEAPAVLHGLPNVAIAATTLAGGCGEGGVVTAGGSYASIDGAEWTRLPIGDHAFAAGAAMSGDRIVIGTDARTNQADVIGVSFWISEAP